MRGIKMRMMLGMFLVAISGFVTGLKFEWLQYVRVVDGDTIVVRNWRDGLEWRVRLMGIDAPALKDCFGEESRNILERHLDDGLISYKRYGYDGYGRILARVYVNGKDIEEMVVAAGAARAYDAREVHDEVRPEKEYFESLYAVQERARWREIGMWSRDCRGDKGEEVNKIAPNDEGLLF